MQSSTNFFSPAHKDAKCKDPKLDLRVPFIPLPLSTSHVQQTNGLHDHLHIITITVLNILTTTININSHAQHTHNTRPNAAS